MKIYNLALGVKCTNAEVSFVHLSSALTCTNSGIFEVESDVKNKENVTDLFDIVRQQVSFGAHDRLLSVFENTHQR